MTRSSEYSEASAIEIDREIRKIVEECYGRAREIISQNRTKLVVLAEALLKHEVLTDEDVEEIIETGRLKRKAGRRKTPSAAARKKKKKTQKGETREKTNPPPVSAPRAPEPDGRDS